MEIIIEIVIIWRRQKFFMFPNKILITGGTGFIGSSLARKLVDEDVEVTLFDMSPDKKRVSDILNRVSIVSGDVSDQNDLEKLFRERNYDVIVHTAAILSLKAEENRLLAFRVNIEGMFNILEFSRRFDIKRVVYLSSMSVFGPNSPMPYGEYSYRDPISFYGVSKVWGEILGRYYSFTYDVDFKCVRLPTVFGPGRRGAGATVSFSKLVEDVVLRRRGIVELPESTMNPVIYIDDVVEIIYKLIFSKKVSREVYNTGGVILSMKMIIEYLRKKFPDMEIIFDVDKDTEKMVMMWNIMSHVAKENELDKLYREYKDIGWRLRYDTYEKILDKYVEDTERLRSILLNI